MTATDLSIKTEPWVRFSSEEARSIHKQPPDNLTNDLNTCKLPVTTTVIESENESTRQSSDNTSLLLEKLPVELITKILRFACTTNSHHETLPMCILKIKTGNQRGRIRRCSGKARGKGKEIQTYRALKITCASFRNIIDATDILFKDNTFEFCSLEELIILKTLTSKQRNAIKSIYLTVDITYGFVMGSPDFPWSLRHFTHTPQRLRDTEAAYYTLGSCHGLHSLYINMDRYKNYLNSFDGPNNQSPFILMDGSKSLDALHSICGLQNFHITTSNHQQHPHSGDFPCCFKGRCLDEIDDFSAKTGILDQSLVEEYKRRCYLGMSLLEQEGKITFQSSN
ncbi:uncharacterized protein EAE98_010308 [Botrytis deweyae]|uniref:DUF7730 domain-containing protein n=1 Tax=Botrytis deweyae TaxID=2478750 RepID=A0ABQ7I927_9HELO|nr:uncharacterized protein EAE98_010308 [Botrytis deweyae]KAF7917203.1 hypothetical protein EAE98_010308 [Botrytis deweyae]